jgi:SAM-dependent methyltransferase
MHERDFRAQRDAIERLFHAVGVPISPQSWILDFGCGQGGLVRAFREAGYEEVHGCDFAEELGDDENFRAIMEPYRLPFDDGAFDCVISAEVFEHVQDYPRALGEIRRVLRSGGTSLHFFPSPYLLREPHVYVPLATVIQWRPWLRFWASLGVRNEFQAGLSAREVARLNYVYLRENTTYYSRRRTLRYARSVFPRARFLEIERLSVRSSKQSGLVDAVARRFPVLMTVWSETHERALLLPG